MGEFVSGIVGGDVGGRKSDPAALDPEIGSPEQVPTESHAIFQLLLVWSNGLYPALRRRRSMTTVGEVADGQYSMLLLSLYSLTWPQWLLKGWSLHCTTMPLLLT